MTVFDVREEVLYTSSVANPLTLCKHCSLWHKTDMGDALSKPNKLALLHVFSTQFISLIESYPNERIFKFQIYFIAKQA